jgi:hypothetical protein
MMIMKFKKWSKYLSLRESVKDVELNYILDKINEQKKLTTREEEFLSKYDSILDSDFSEFYQLSKNDTFLKVSNLLNNKKKVICDLYDRNGRIEDDIISIHNDFEDEKSIMNLKHGEVAYLYDRFLYDIKYDFQKDVYSLCSGEEFFEKISINNED